LTGFSNLKEFYCFGNQLTNLDLSKNVNLSVLDCHFNQLTNLDLSKNVNLKELCFFFNQLTNLDLSKNVNLSVLSCPNNQLISVDFLSKLPYPEKLETLVISDNNIQPTTLDFLKPFVNLKDCKLGENILKDAAELKLRLEKGTYNKFFGSLEPIKNLIKLEEFCIAGTDIEEGLEYIPSKIVELSVQAVKEGKDPRQLNLIDCQPLREDAKVAKIQDQLRPFNYDLEA